MRILAVADFFYPDTVGGSAIMAYEILREMVVRGHEVTVVTRLQSGLDPKDTIAGMEVYRYSMPQRQSMYPLGVIRAERLIKDLLSKRKYDVINMHHAAAGLAAERVRGNRHKLPSVFVFQGPWYKEAMAKDGHLDEEKLGSQDVRPYRYRLRRWADRYILEHCTAFVTLSDHMRHEALKIVPAAKLKHQKIQGGVDTERFKPAADRMVVRRELSLPEDKIILLSVRRLATRMGLENLVQAMVTIERERDDIILLIGGRGEIEEKLRRQIRELGLQRTKLVGYIAYDKELPKYYQASDLFVMPSITLEGFGLSTAESLACGTPVAGTPTGGTPEILREVLPEFILSGTTADDIATGILKLVDQSRSDDIRAKARKYAETHSWQRITGEFETLFNEVVRGGRES